MSCMERLDCYVKEMILVTCPISGKPGLPVTPVPGALKPLDSAGISTDMAHIMHAGTQSYI